MSCRAAVSILLTPNEVQAEAANNKQQVVSMKRRDVLKVMAASTVVGSPVVPLPVRWNDYNTERNLLISQLRGVGEVAGCEFASSFSRG